MSARFLVGERVHPPRGTCSTPGKHRPARLRRLICGTALLLVTGCATTPPVGQRDLLAFVTDGATTKSEIYLRLGPPGREFEGGRIAAWRVAEDEGGYYLVASSTHNWQGSRHEFVVVFSADSRVERHSLVQLR
jgi:hypothetical protein